MSSIPQAADRPSTAKEEIVKEKGRLFGDLIDFKEKGSIRIMFQNVNGFGYTTKSVKSLGIRDMINDKKVDVMAMAELNKNWGKMRRPNTLPQVCKGWFRRCRTVVAYNQHERRKKKGKIHQPGGTAVVSKGDMALRSGKAEYDSLRLGRWSSQVFQGKHGVTTRVVSVYVPILVSTHGHKKVAVQQQKAFLAMGIKDNVITKFWSDLWKQIDGWLGKGEQLIIGGDWNTDVTKEKFLQQFSKRNLIPTTSTRHGKQLPETHNNGSKPIDEIFISSTLQITAAGYLEHGSAMSDHRPIWVDLTRDTVLGVKATKAPTYEARRLKTNDPRIVDNYISTLKEILVSYNFESRSKHLFETMHYPLTKEQQLEYEELDAIRIEAAKEAEAKCRKLKMGQIQWSPKIQGAMDRIRYYCLSKRRFLGRKVSASILYRLAKKTGCNAIGLTEEELNKQIDNSFKYYKTLRKKNEKLRENHLAALAAALEKKGKGKKAKIVKGLVATEKQRELFRKLKFVHEKNKDLSTKYVTVNTPQGKVIITDKQEMEKAIINENKDKYHQTESTCPFMHSPLKEHFGEKGLGPYTEDVLQGNYNIPSTVSEYTRDYLELCRMPEGELIINPLTRSLDYFCQSWKKMKERTGCRGLHFGHYKAVTEYNDIMELYYRMAEIPFRSGYVPTRWKKANNVMILKKEGVSDLDRLRTLVLFESDFNHNNKFLGREMMHQIIDKEHIAKEQYSRPGRKCIDHVVNRRLYFDLVRYQKVGAAMAAVDLKSCYDRVAHAPAYLAMRSYGIPSQPIECMFQAIQDMQYYTITYHGVSTVSFGGQEKGYKAKPNGLGQGNGGGPTSWSVQSSKMFQVMHKRGSSTKITSPITGSEEEISGFAYVDDTDLIVMQKEENDAQTTVNKMQNVVNDWEGVAKTTGGALAPSKCWCWIINFGWKADTWYYKDTTTMNLSMTVKDERNFAKELVLLPPHVAKEMLGVRLSPDGNNDDQITIAKEKMKHLSEQIRVGHINKHEAWVSLNSITMKTLEYMLPAMTITEEEYREIMSPVLAQFLPKMGINRNIKRDILYATSAVQGFNLRNPYISQGVEHVKDICENLWKETLTGHLLKCNLEQLRIEIGENVDILSSNYYDFEPQLLTQSYIRNTWKFVSENNITLNDATAFIRHNRDGDCELMSSFRNNDSIPVGNLKILNRCRIYIKAFLLSDITTSCGQFIRNEAWHGRVYNNGNDRSNWPIWGRPSLSDWTYWRTALRLTFCKDRDKKLDNQLGHWINIPHQWEYFAVPWQGSFKLLRRSKEKWYCYNKIGRSKLIHRYKDKGRKVTEPPIHLIYPVTVTQSHKSLIMHHPSSINIPYVDDNNSQIRTGWLHVDELKKGSEYRLCESIRHGKAIAVSDGSFSDEVGKGTASWIISTLDKHDYITAGALSPGGKDVQSAYRSEVLGLLGVLEEIYNLCERRNIVSGHCNIYCDGLSALQVIQRLTRDSMNTKYTSCDLLSACVILKEKIPIELSFTHVKGHQDDKNEVHNLTVPSQLNVLMDGSAKDLLNNEIDHEIDTNVLHTFSFQLPTCVTTILQNLKSELYKAITNKKGHEYWIQKKRYDKEDMDTIDWMVQEQAFSSEKSTRQRKLSKWISGWLGTGKNMRRWNLRYKGNCPFCNQPDEDTLHILQCKSESQTTAWKTCVSELDATLIKQKTCYSLRKVIIVELRAWRNNTNAPPWHNVDHQLKAVIMEQRRIGWRSFLEGLFSQRLVGYQKAYLKTEYPDKKISVWTKRIIKAGWKLLMKMWESRNQQLHQPDKILEMEGKKELNKCIAAEWEVGLSDLPPFEFTHLFRIKKEKLMEKSIEGKKDWLAMVKMARELYEDRNINIDKFDSNQALREWIGLPKKKTARH